MKIETLLFKEICILPELFLGISIIYLLLHGSFLVIQKSYPLIYNSVVYLTVLTLIFSCYLLINDNLNVLELGILNNTIINDYISFSTKFIIAILSIFSLIIIEQYLKDQKINYFEYTLLILFSILGLFLLCSANDLITAYLAIELQSLSFYVLAAFKKNSTFSVDAGIKYFILGAFSSSLFLFGASFLYGFSGTVNFEEFKDLFFYAIPENVTKNELNIFNLIYYYNLLELLKTDVAKIMLENPQSLEIFPSLFNYENFNYNSTIDQIVIITDIFNKLEVSLFNLIFTFNNFDWSYFLADVNKENLTEVSNINTLMLLSMCDIIDSYLQNTFFSINFFDVNFLKFALLFILISLFFKLAIAPFHVWAPDVYENSPSASTFFFSVVPKLALFVLLFRIFYSSFYSFIEGWRYFIVIVIVLTVIVGSFGGIVQKKLKSLLVYSSISHMGYSLIAFSTGTFEGIQMLFCYLIIYSFSGLCLWSIFLLTRLKNNYLQKQNKDLTDLVLLGKSNYMLSVFFVTTLLSIAGFPPMIGFLVKISVFLTAIEVSMFYVALLSILCSVIATYYYIKIIKILYFEKILTGKLYYPISENKSLIIVMLFYLFIFLFINPTLLFLFSYKISLLSLVTTF